MSLSTHTLIEKKVACTIKRYLSAHGLDSTYRLDLFDHQDDASERSFITDLAAYPIATKGNRTDDQIVSDKTRFNQCTELDQIAQEIQDCCVFPVEEDFQRGWQRKKNQNPMVGLAFEIENATSKYFLGSLLAAAIAGRWGILVVSDNRKSDLWVNTLRRMIYKGETSPIPSNIIVVKWPALKNMITGKRIGTGCAERGA